MSHTDEFNKIMQNTNKEHKKKAAKAKVVPVLIGARDNMNDLQTSISKYILYAI